MPKKAKSVHELRERFIDGCRFITRAVEEKCDPENLEVLGIDPSLTSTGFAYRDLREKVKTGVIKSEFHGFIRTIDIRKRLNHLMLEKKPFCVIEGYSYNSRWNREALAELGGVIRELMVVKKRPLFVVSPLTVKAWLKAKKKEQIMLEILDKFKVKISSSDAADAFVLQHFAYTAVRLAQDVMQEDLRTPDDVRLYLKDQTYQKNNPKDLSLFKYQAESLMRIIGSQGPNVEIYLLHKPEL